MNGEPVIDPVQEASEESYPASDSPAWTSLTATGGPAHPQGETKTRPKPTDPKADQKNEPKKATRDPALLEATQTATTQREKPRS